jgi:hypothetical protein
MTLHPKTFECLRLHGLQIVDSKQGRTAFKKLVQVKPGPARPSASQTARRVPMRR